MHKLTPRSFSQSTLAALLGLALLAPSQAAMATDVDDQLVEAWQDVCIPFSPPELFVFCAQLFPGGAASGIGAPGAVNTANLGITGSQTRTPGISSGQQTESVKERLQRLQDETDGDRGTGASADFAWGNWGLTVALQSANTDRDQTLLENGYDADLNGVLLGLDYQFSDRLIAGVAAGYTSSDSDFDGNVGKLELKSRTINLYGTYLPTDNTYLNAYAGYSDLDSRNRRRVVLSTIIDTTVSGSTDGDQVLAGLSAGYNWYSGAWTAGPFVSLDYVRSDQDGYTERGNTNLEMRYEDQSSRSLTSAIGFQASVASQFDWGTLIPSLRLSYLHEHKDDAQRIDTYLAVDTTSSNPISVLTDDPDRNYFLTGIGAAFELRGGMQLFVDYERNSGHSYLDTWAVSAGVLVPF